MDRSSPLSAEKQALLRARLKGAARPPVEAPRIAKRSNDGPAPLSFAQFYIWVADQKAPGTPAHNLPVGFRVKGPLDAPLLQDALNAVVQRHEALRTTFSVADGEPVQIVHKECRIRITAVDLAHLPAGEREVALHRLATEESVASFDLSRLPLLRVSLYKLADDEHVLLLNLHHIVGDGLSITLLLQELDARYGALRSGKPLDLPALSVQYADFAAWLRDESKQGYPQQEQYWRTQLAERIRSVHLPFDRARPALPSFEGSNVSFVIPRPLAEKLGSLDPEGGGSFFSIALAAYQALLHRYSGSQQMLILAPISIRSRDELTPLIGNFLNLVPLRCDLSGEPTFAELLRRSRDATFGALSNKDLPFDRIVERLTIERDSARDPVFQFLLQVLPEGGARASSLDIAPFPVNHAFAQFDLSLHLYGEDGGYRGRFEYSSDLFDAETVRGFASTFLQLLEAVSADPEKPVGMLPISVAAARGTAAAHEQPAKKAPHIAPQSVLEKQIAQVWREMLQIDQVGVTENFFELGGHSLLVARTVERLRAELGRELSVVDLFAFPTVEALARHLSGDTRTATPADNARVQANRGDGREPEPIAIIGMAGRFPGASDIEAFWANLRQGKESITFFTPQEMREAGVPDEVLANPDYVGAMGYLEGADRFDASFFGYSAREAGIIDPQHRLLLECASETLERAGYDPDRYGGLIGVYAGASLNTYLSSLEAQGHLPGSAGRISVLLGNGRDFLTTRISYKLNLRGPSVNVQTACSTSLVAVHQACRALQDQECDMALAGGVSVMLPLRSGNVYMQEGMYSPDGHCRAFDAGANGTVGGNGVALVLLKRLSDALADGDNIHAVIRGTAINNDGSSKVGYTAPSVEAEARVIARAQASAGCDPDTIGYVEAHGTGTLLGDPIEMAALTSAFGNGKNSRSACWIGSVKSNIGHLDVAAGVTGLIKAALSLEHKELVPSPNYRSPNPQIDFEATRFRVNAELRPWEAADGWPRRAGVSAFGFGGTNAHVVLEEAPALKSSEPSRQGQLLCLSAKTESALAQAAANLGQHLREQPQVNLGDVAYTLQVGRREFPHRAVLACSDTAEAALALDGNASRLIRGLHKGGARAVQFMFPGQGAQYPNMGLGLYRSEAVFRRAVDQCCQELKSRSGLDLRAILFPAEGATGAAAEQLKRTEFTQPALFTIEYALAKLWMSWGMRPTAMIGHSIGEYVAACLAGVMALDDALGLVAERGRLMGQLPAGAMLAVPLPEAEARSLLDNDLSIASVNSPSLCIASGKQEAIAALETRLAGMGLAPRRLHTSHAFHSAMMDPILQAFTRQVERIALKPPQLPYISNVTGQWITAEQATDPSYYARHLREAVQFSGGLEQLFNDPGSVFLEIGPGHTLTALARRHPARKPEHAFIASMRHADEAQPDEAALMEGVGRLWLAGVTADWRELHGTPRRRLRLPTYPFEQKRYWLEPDKGSPKAKASGRERLNRVDDPAQWTYVPSWRRTPTSLTGANKRGASWLIFADGHGLGTQLAARLAEGGATVASVEAGERFAKKGDGKYVINPAAKEDYERLLAELAAASFTPQFVAHLWSIRRDEELRDDEDFRSDCKQRGFYSLILLAQALDARGPKSPVGLAVLTSHVHEVEGSERLCPENAMALGPCKVIGMEHPLLRVRSIDLSLKGDLNWLSQALANDLSALWVEPVVAYRAKYRWAQAFEQADFSREKSSPGPVREAGAYLITGGLGLVGLGIADSLARTARVRLVLVGRKGLPPRESWARWLDEHGAEDAVSRGIRRVMAIESTGAEVLVCAADVTDEAGMRKVIDAAEVRFGPLRGVVHAAGAEARPTPILSLERSGAEEQFLPKVQGLRALERVLRGKRLDFCVVNSSLASVMGIMDYVSYTAAHSFIDAFVLRHNREEPAAPWHVVNWDHWVTESSSAPQGFYMLPAQATDVLSRILSTTDAAQVVVSTGDLQRRIDQVIPREALPEDEATAADAQQPQGHSRPALSSAYEAPRNDAERLLVDIWQKMLGIDPVGIHDNFFELGGDSVISIQITAKANQAGLRFTPKQAFEHQTIAALAAAISSSAGAAAVVDGKDEVVDTSSAGPEPIVSDADMAEIARQLEVGAL